MEHADSALQKSPQRASGLDGLAVPTCPNNNKPYVDTTGALYTIIDCSIWAVMNMNTLHGTVLLRTRTGGKRCLLWDWASVAGKRKEGMAVVVAWTSGGICAGRETERNGGVSRTEEGREEGD